MFARRRPGRLALFSLTHTGRISSFITMIIIIIAINIAIALLLTMRKARPIEYSSRFRSSLAFRLAPSARRLAPRRPGSWALANGRPAGPCAAPSRRAPIPIRPLAQSRRAEEPTGRHAAAARLASLPRAPLTP